MCGIAGLWTQTGKHDDDTLAHIAGSMGEAVAHRGPDGDGVWTDPAQASPSPIADCHHRPK